MFSFLFHLQDTHQLLLYEKKKCRTDVALNEKLKSKKRFNFHKKAKICTTTNSPLCSNSHALCKEGILQLRELIKFLVLEQSKEILFGFPCVK